MDKQNNQPTVAPTTATPMGGMIADTPQSPGGGYTSAPTWFPQGPNTPIQATQTPQSPYQGAPMSGSNIYPTFAGGRK